MYEQSVSKFGEHEVCMCSYVGIAGSSAALELNMADAIGPHGHRTDDGADHSPAPVLTGLSLAVNALIARRRAWSPAQLVPSVCARLDSVAAMRLLAVLPEEIESDQLALSELQLDAFC